MRTLIDVLHRMLENPTTARLSTQRPFAPVGSQSLLEGKPTAQEIEDAAVFEDQSKSTLPLTLWWAKNENAATEDETAIIDVRTSRDGHQVVLRLAPPNVGHVTAVLTFVDNDVWVRLIADEKRTVQTIARWLPGLQESLAELFHVKSVHVMPRQATRLPKPASENTFERFA